MRLLASLLLSLLIASSASSVTMDWTFVGDPGNPCDPQQNQGCFGSVGYTYNIGTYEVTNAQYAEFLNAKAKSGSLGLYNPEMGIGPSLGRGGITRSGVSGSYTYSVIAGREDLPVNIVSFYNAVRFANWMNNGQGNGDTETGAYTLFGGTPQPTNGFFGRNAGATIFLPSEDEWYKAAYYDSSSASYFDYPAGSNTATTCSIPTAIANRANCGNNTPTGDLTPVGSYTGSPSPYGTFDQAGNVFEWNDTLMGFDPIYRGDRGGSYGTDPYFLQAAVRVRSSPTFYSEGQGFRIAMIPEPGTGLLVAVGLIGFASRRRARN